MRSAQGSVKRILVTDEDWSVRRVAVTAKIRHPRRYEIFDIYRKSKMEVTTDEVDVEAARRICRESRRKNDKSSSSGGRDGSSSAACRKTIKRKRPRFVPGELPTPPPNPVGVFNERVGGVGNSASKAAVTALGVADAFDHLDKLHSMMEEILEMRDRNAKLFKRVRDLERAKATRKANVDVERIISMGQDPLLPDEDVGFAESLLGAMLSSSYELSPARSSVARASPSGRITRSLSTGTEHRRVSCPVTADTQHRNSSRARRISELRKKRPSLAVGTPKVSKWTRVKAAFKWERAACTATDATTEPEVSLRYLRIPENAGGSSEVSGPPTPAGTISSSSSIDDVFHRPQRPSSNQSSRITRRDDNSDPSRRSRSLDGDASVPMTFVYSPRPRSKDNASFQGKSGESRGHKTPWGKVKDMMQLRRDSIGRNPMRSGSRNEDAHSTSSLDSSDIHRSEQQADGRPPRVRITTESATSPVASPSKPGPGSAPNDFVDLASRRLTPTLTITVPSSEELRSISSPESITPPSARQSFESGKSERCCQTGYETPKETRTGQVSPASSGSGILRYGLGRSKTCQGVPFAGDFKRQQSLKGESLGSSPKMQRRDSKWNKVKRAFLTSATSVPTSPSRISSYFFDDGDATGGSYSASASAEDLDTEGPTNPGAQAEIQRNYKLLHEKLGTEFYRKLAEWEKLKSNSPTSRDPSKSNAREKDAENLRLLGEERLTPEFKKKLEEWKRMNKGAAAEARGSSSSDNRSVNRRRITDWQLWRSPSKPDSKPDSPRLSEDFIKKMEDWKRMKSAAARREAEDDAESLPREIGAAVGEAKDEEVEEEEEEEAEEEEEEEERGVVGVRLSEERRRAWKNLEDEEFRSLERVLDAMEMDRQTRLSKLQRIVGSLPQRTEEVLIHTSTGLYRFEGISRKFTRKLYEWEKSQGISPELSTFRLLDPLRHGLGSLRARASPVDPADGGPRRTRHRSKSVGSVQTHSWRTTRDHEKPAMRRPSSLSLNDVDNHEARSCIIASSIPTIPDEEEDTSEDIALEDSEAEPEAVIVDIEDVIEETASPLRKYQPHQTPVYSVAGSETTSIAIPLGTVTARHEPSPVILIEPGEFHQPRGRVCSIDDKSADRSYAIVSTSETNVEFPSSSSVEGERSIAGGRRSKRDAGERADKLSGKDGVGKSERDIIVVGADQDGPPMITRCSEFEDPGVVIGSAKNWQMVQFTTDCDPGTVQRGERPTTEEDEAFEDAVITVRSNVRHSKKILKTRRLTDTQVGYDWRTSNAATASNVQIVEAPSPTTTGNFENNPNVERIIINEDTINKIVVPTASSSGAIAVGPELGGHETDDQHRDSESIKEKREARSVFVKTKRIVFSPFRRDGKNKSVEIAAENSNADGSSTRRRKLNPQASAILAEASSIEESPEVDKSNGGPTGRSRSSDPRVTDSKRPPLPKSPILSRKEYRVSSPKETAPSVRTMITRYNARLDSETSIVERYAISSSANSSASGGSSPSWRTPIIDRRLSTRMERYDEAKKTVGSRKTCCRSCNDSCDHASVPEKSSSADFSRQGSSSATRRRSPSAGSDDPTLTGTNNDLVFSSSVRAMKIRRAKEDFLSREPAREESSRGGKIVSREQVQGPKSNEIGERDEETEAAKDCSIAVKSDITKSASAGMINVDADTYERLAAAASRGCDSLPRSNEHLRRRAETKERTGRLSQIAGKFKRARLRRAKEKGSGGMSTVSMLCRQSLLVDIANDSSAGSSEVSGNGDKSATSDRTTHGSSRRPTEDDESKDRRV